jgi:hypothetical protein
MAFGTLGVTSRSLGNTNFLYAWQRLGSISGDGLRLKNAGESAKHIATLRATSSNTVSNVLKVMLGITAQMLRVLRPCAF